MSQSLGRQLCHLMRSACDAPRPGCAPITRPPTAGGASHPAGSAVRRARFHAPFDRLSDQFAKRCLQVKVAEHVLTGHKVAIKILNRRKIKQMDMEEKGARAWGLIREPIKRSAKLIGCRSRDGDLDF